jgi:hypothetical protein
MKKSIFLIPALFFAFVLTAMAQTYEVPKNYILKTKEDYPKYNQDIINTVDWLQQTSWDEQPDKRKEANSFLIAWVTGSPSVSITVGSPLTKLADKNSALLITFIGGYTKYTIQHPDATDKNAPNVAGLKALIEKYKMEKNHVKDSSVEKLIKIDQDGKLEQWAATDFIK